MRSLQQWSRGERGGWRGISLQGITWIELALSRDEGRGIVLDAKFTRSFADISRILHFTVDFPFGALKLFQCFLSFLIETIMKFSPLDEFSSVHSSQDSYRLSILTDKTQCLNLNLRFFPFSLCIYFNLYQNIRTNRQGSRLTHCRASTSSKFLDFSGWSWLYGQCAEQLTKQYIIFMWLSVWP